MPEHVPTPEPLKRAREKSDTGSASEVEEMIVKKKSKVLKKVTLDSVSPRHDRTDTEPRDRG